jgi:hypothetical protein
MDIFNDVGEFDDDAAHDAFDRVVALFNQTPESKSLAESVGAPEMLLHFAGAYHGVPLAEISVDVLREVLFDQIPRKVAYESKDAPAIVAELRAFWTWLDREFALPSARECLALLNDRAADILAAALADETNFSMGKSLIALGKQSGFDMTTQEGLQAFMAHYNAKLAARETQSGAVPSRKSRDERRKKHKQQRAAKRRNRR